MPEICLGKGKNRQNQCKSLLETRSSATMARVSNENSTKRVASTAFFRILLGLAYKEHTHSTKNSPALTLLGRLRDTSPRPRSGRSGRDRPLFHWLFRAAGLRRGCGRARAHNAMAAISRTADRRSCTAHDRTGVDRSIPSIIRWVSRGSGVRMSRPRDAAARARRAWVTAMREHGNDRPVVPERVVVMGAGGFVGNAIACRLDRTAFGGWPGRGNQSGCSGRARKDAITRRSMMSPNLPPVSSIDARSER